MGFMCVRLCLAEGTKKGLFSGWSLKTSLGILVLSAWGFRAE